MLRFALLSVFLVPAAAFAQTADVLPGPAVVRQGPVTAVTYDLAKLMKANPDLNTTDKILARLTVSDRIRKANGKSDPGESVTVLSKNRITVQAHASIHAEIQDQLDWWQKPVEKRAALDAALPNVPAGALPPPGPLPLPGFILPPLPAPAQKKKGKK